MWSHDGSLSEHCLSVRVVGGLQALTMHNSVLGQVPLRVQRSSTAMQRIMSDLLPKSNQDHHRCYYCTHMTICLFRLVDSTVVIRTDFGKDGRQNLTKPEPQSLRLCRIKSIQHLLSSP